MVQDPPKPETPKEQPKPKPKPKPESPKPLKKEPINVVSHAEDFDRDYKPIFDGVSLYSLLQLCDDKRVTSVLMEGLREVFKQRPNNSVQFLGKFLVEHS